MISEKATRNFGWLVGWLLVTGHLPPKWQRGLFVLCKVVVPYVIDHLSKQQILVHLMPRHPRPSDPGPSNIHSMDMEAQQPSDIYIFLASSYQQLRHWCLRHSENIQ